MNGTMTLAPTPQPLQVRKTFAATQDSVLGEVQVADELGFAYLDGDIDFGATGKQEIFQNIKYIILTEFFSVPLDREFGMDYSMVDKPMAIAEAILSQEVATKIALYEPRAQFREINFVRDELVGKLSPSVVVVLLTAEEAPSMYTTLPAGTPTTAAPAAAIAAVDLPAFYATLVELAKIPGPPGPAGPQGETGPPNILSVQSTTTGAPGTSAAVTIAGTSPSQALAFTIPRGDVGAAATATAGTTVTGAPGTNANVVNAGTSSAAIFNFTIPRGDVGPQGPQGVPGPPGGLGEAPVDGQQYARQSAAWSVVAAASAETGATILAKLVTVDGTGSNLDADVLDGQDSAFYRNASNLNAGTLPAARFDDSSHGNRAGGALHAAVTTGANGFMVAADKSKLDAFAAAATYAPLASPTFTGDPKAPTPAPADNDTSIATTAFVQNVAATKLSATAETRNRFINPAMQISQQNPVGGTSAASASGSYYAADQWAMNWTTTGSLVCIHGVATPNGSPYSVYYNIQTPAGSQPAGGIMLLSQKIEGKMVAECFWGTGSARAAVVRFWMYGQIGTYTFWVRNGAADRSYLAAFNLTVSNIFQPITIVVPGDVTGTWAKDNTCGIEAGISFAAAPSNVGIAGWQAGNKVTLASQFNGMGVAGASYAVGDFGFYFDPANTGIAPPWQFPDEGEQLQRCLRYFEIVSSNGFGFSGQTTSGVVYSARGRWRVTKRVAPAITAVNGGANAFPTTPGSFGSVDTDAFGEGRSANATGSGGFSTTVTGNARM